MMQNHINQYKCKKEMIIFHLIFSIFFPSHFPMNRSRTTQNVGFKMTFLDFPYFKSYYTSYICLADQPDNCRLRVTVNFASNELGSFFFKKKPDFQLP